jgi:hypothetical protein
LGRERGRREGEWKSWVLVRDTRFVITMVRGLV